MTREMSVVGIDIAKRVLHLVGRDGRGQIVRRQRCSRGEVLPWTATLGPTTMGMEACGGAHDWAWRLREQGHPVTLTAPQCVQPAVHAHKNAMRDAAAIADAVTRPSMRCVPVPDVAQHESHALHRVRERLVTARPALVHAMRGLCAEYGLI
jgi:transposase